MAHRDWTPDILKSAALAHGAEAARRISPGCGLLGCQGGQPHLDCEQQRAGVQFRNVGRGRRGRVVGRRRQPMAGRVDIDPGRRRQQVHIHGVADVNAVQQPRACAGYAAAVLRLGPNRVQVERHDAV
jgi:hypothetical protein